jgi:hypothetical protein
MKVYLLFTFLLSVLCIRDIIEKSDFNELANILLTNGTMVSHGILIIGWLS